MKFKLIAVLSFLSIFLTFSIQPSWYDDSDDDIDDIQYEEKEVAVSSEMTYRLIQMFTHEAHHYKNIEYGELYQNYQSKVTAIAAIVLEQSKLSRDEQFNSYAYTIVGEEQIWRDEPLFDCVKARNILIQRL